MNQVKDDAPLVRTGQQPYQKDYDPEPDRPPYSFAVLAIGLVLIALISFTIAGVCHVLGS